ncbi:MAG: HupE/UreJ family protein, partial [Pseudomonadota bacterium]
MAHLLRTWTRVVFALVLSILAMPGTAHEVEPSFAEIDVDADRVTIALRTAVEPLIAEMDLTGLDNTEDSPLAQRHDDLRLLPPDEIRAALDAAWPRIAERIVLRAGEADLPIDLLAAEIPEIGDAELRRDAQLTLVADLPPGNTPVTFGLEASLGTLIVRQAAGYGTYEAILTGGSTSDPLPRAGVADVSAGDAFLRNMVVGFEHIIPAGLDHILFVLG